MTDSQTTEEEPVAEGAEGAPASHTAFRDVFDPITRHRSHTKANFFGVPKGLGGTMSNSALHMCLRSK